MELLLGIVIVVVLALASMMCYFVYAFVKLLTDFAKEIDEHSVWFKELHDLASRKK